MIFSLNVCAAERLAANSQASNEAIDDSEFEFLIERERATDHRKVVHCAWFEVSYRLYYYRLQNRHFVSVIKPSYES